MWTDARNHCRGDGRRRGGALLAVLWLAAALSAIAFSVANTVRVETERTSTAADGARAYYLATGAFERAMLYILWGPQHRNPDGSPRYFANWMPRLAFQFPSGEAIVEVIPEAARLSLNRAVPEDLFRLLVALGAEPERAQEITQGILDWRMRAPADGFSPFDRHYLSLAPSFRARHASFEEVEEVLLVKGMTPELYHGGHATDADGRLRLRPGFKDCVSVYGSTSRFDVNSAPAPLLAALGLGPDVVARLVEMRRVAPFVSGDQLDSLRQFGGPGAQRLGVGGRTMYTLRATARLRLPDGRLSDLRRTVAATVKIWGQAANPPYQVLRWYEGTVGETAEWN